MIKTAMPSRVLSCALAFMLVLTLSPLSNLAYADQTDKSEASVNSQFGSTQISSESVINKEVKLAPAARVSMYKQSLPGTGVVEAYGFNDIISVEAPLKLVFDTSDSKGYDVKNPPANKKLTATSSFYNTSSNRVRITKIAVDQTGMSNVFTTNPSFSIKPDGGNEIPFTTAGLTKQKIDIEPAVSNGQRIPLGCTFGLDLSGATLKTDQTATSDENSVSFGKFVYTFEILKSIIGKGEFNSIVNDQTSLNAKPFYLKFAVDGVTSAYSLKDVETMSDSLVSDGTLSPYYSIFKNTLVPDNKSSVDALSTINYDCRIKTTQTNQYTNSKMWPLRIIGFNQDGNWDNKGNFTPAGITFQFLHVLSTSGLRASNDNNTGGWGSATLRTTMNSGTVFNYIDATARGYMKSVTKWYGKVYNSTSEDDVDSSTDQKMWIASFIEMTNGIYGSNYPYYGLEGVGASHNSGYDFYKQFTFDNTWYNSSNNITVKYNGTNKTKTSYWTRSLYRSGSYHWMQVNSTDSTRPGRLGESAAQSASLGVVPCFCL